MTSARAALAALVAGVLTALLMGCGVDTQDAGTPTTPTTATRKGTGTTQTSTAAENAVKKLPKRPAGVVEVDGPAQGAFTPRAVAAGVPGVSVNFHPVGDTQGFADLCAGRIDVHETSRAATRAEIRACARNGLVLVQPIQVASDAIVVATRNESDVGGDCLRLSTLNDIFRAGSPLTDWSQVGFYNIPIRTTGREASSASFQFFAQAVLGVGANASLADVRSDYLVHLTDDGVRREVTSEARVARVNARFKQRIADAVLARQIALQESVDRAIRRARDAVLRQIDRENKRRAAQKITLTTTQKILIARSNLRRINAATRAAQNRAVARFTYPQLTFLRARYHRALKLARISGTIGIFRFSYYELYENLLRPMEIWDPDRAAEALSRMTGVKVVRGNTPSTTSGGAAAAGTTGTGTTATGTTATTTTTTGETPPAGTVVVNPDTTPWCVFPSQTTITNGSYPLSRRIFLYVSQHNLKRPEVQTFLRSYLNNAQTLASRARLVPIPDTLLETNLALVEGQPAPSNTTTTSTTSTTSTTATVPGGNVPGVGTGGTSTTTTTTP